MSLEKPMTDESIMPFGKYKGDRLKYVPDNYLIWLYEENKCFVALKQYIKENLID